MKRSLVATLDLENAAAEEASSVNRLLPPMPGWDVVSENPNAISQWLRARLRSGLNADEEVIVGAKKGQHGVRPFSIWGAAERILYRALVDRLLASQVDLDRSVEAYRGFIHAPIHFAISRHGARARATLTARASSTRYVVKTDIAAFYQYIDHEVLANELALTSGDFELIDVVIDLLQETQGRKFGLPQGFHASDRLSDLYIQIVERKLARQGLSIWRFNDDFRIACDSYTAAMDAIEKFDSAARDVGLVMNEYKTTSPHFDTYVEEVLGLADDDLLLEGLDNGDEESDENGGEYTDLDSMDVERANRTIKAVRVPERRGAVVRGRDIRQLSPENIRDLRLAWNALRRAQDPGAIDYVRRFLSYSRSLTPQVVGYLGAVADQSPNAVREALADVLDNVSLNDWQRGWLASLMQNEMIFAGETSDKSGHALLDWLDGLAKSAGSPMLQAQAVNALAHLDAVTFDLVEELLRSAPGALVGWYVDAARALAEDDDSLQPRFEALLSTTTQARWMLVQ